mgnify:CR=1 FL=1
MLLLQYRSSLQHAAPPVTVAPNTGRYARAASLHDYLYVNGQQNDIIEELRNQNGNDATRQKMLSQLIEINKDMSEVMKKPNEKPDHQVQPPQKSASKQ